MYIIKTNVPAPGFEPGAFGLEVQRAIDCLPGHHACRPQLNPL